MDFNPTYVRAELARLNKTQEELARDVGVGASTMNRWLRGKVKPIKIYQRKVAEVLEEWNNGVEDSEQHRGSNNWPKRDVC